MPDRTVLDVEREGCTNVCMEAKKRPDPPKLSLLKGEFITLLVGDDRKVYSVHKNLLCHHSKYFANLLNGPFSDASERSFDIDDVSEETADLFVEWIYATESASNTSSYAERVRIHHLTLLYIFADQYDFPQLRLDLVRRIYQHYRYQDEVCETYAELPAHWLEESDSEPSVDYENLDLDSEDWPEDIWEMNDEDGGVTESETEDASSVAMDEHLSLEEPATPDGTANDGPPRMKKSMKGLIDQNNHKFLWPAHIPLETVALAYEHLQSSCPLIRMFVDFFACDWNPNTVLEEDQAWMEAIPSEFFVDIIRCSVAFRALDMVAVRHSLEHYLDLEKEQVVERPQKRGRSPIPSNASEQELATPSKRPRRSRSVRSSRTERQTPGESSGLLASSQ